MSAFRLHRFDLSETTRLIFHHTVKTLQGQIVADATFGPVMDLDALMIHTSSCARCFETLNDSEIQDNEETYQGHASFYLCHDCQRDSTGVVTSKELDPVEGD